MATDRVVDALTDSTKAIQTSTRRMDALERRIDGFEGTIATRLVGLEREMGTMNAKLDNLVREAQITNELLKQDGQERRDEISRKRKIEDEDRAHAKEMAKQNRDAGRTVAAEVWRVLSQPLAFLATGVVGWLLYQYFEVPEPKVEPPVAIGAPSNE